MTSLAGSLPPKKPLPPRYIAVPFTSGGGFAPIPAPTLSVVTQTSSSITLKITYAGPPGATSFSFETATAGTGPFTPLASGASNSFLDSGLLAATTYFFRGRVQVVDGRFSDYTPVISGTTLAGVPGQPQGLVASATGTSSVHLSWTTVAQATGYNVYRGGVFVSSSASTSFDDTGLNPGTTYSYTVSATNSSGEGPQSVSSSATTNALAAGGIKWHPGIGMASDQQPLGRRGFTYLQGEIGNLFPYPNLKLYRFMINWSTIETDTKGVYDFSQVKQILDYLQANGKRGLIQFNPGDFNGGPLNPSSTNDASFIPTYVLKNPGTYGPAFGTTDPNGAGGYYAQTSTGYCANFQNANVMAALTAAINAWGASTAGDSHPALEGVGLCENSNMEPNSASGLGSGHETAWFNLLRVIQNAFPSTLTYGQMAFTNNGTQGQVNQVNSAMGFGIGMGSPDCYPSRKYAPVNGNPTTVNQWGLGAYCGFAFATGLTGLVDWRPTTHAILDSQEAEVIIYPTQVTGGVPVSDFVAGANLLGATHWTYTFVGSGRGNTENQWAQAAPILNTSSLNKTAFPTKLTQLGYHAITT